jgi:hypothetical protein
LILVLAEPEASFDKLSSELCRTGASVLLAGDGSSAMRALREHNVRISSLVTDTAVRGGLSGRALPFWYRFYNPFGPVIYLSHEPSHEFVTVQYSGVLKRRCRSAEVIREISRIEEEVRSAYAADARIAGWTLSA